MEIAGYIASALIGISLGLIGGGGSILTVPMLVYLFALQPMMATSYSLFIVGLTSLVGAVNNWRKGYISLRTALTFGITSMLTVYATRKFILPLIPKEIVRIGNFVITEPFLTMVLFALLMLVASLSMIRGPEKEKPASDHILEKRFPQLLVLGISIGLITGFLGAGGGFLLIPALVLIVRLPMKTAIGTSLLIIALNNLVGFSGDIGHFQIHWPMLLSITAIAIAGVIVGGILSKPLSGNKLKKGFGWFVLLMGIIILIKEIFLK